MTAPQRKIRIKIPKSYSKNVRLAVAQDVIDQIIERTQKKRLDKNGSPFKSGYTKEYASSPEGKVGGKKKGAKPNLTLSGDMLSELRLLKQEKGEITIGYKKGSLENEKADGNIRGTYGQKKGSRKKARNFLGVSAKELNDIKALFPIRDRQKQQERVELLDAADKSAAEITGSVTVAKLDNEQSEDEL